MERATGPLQSVRAIGRLDDGGTWIGFGYRAGTCRIVVGTGDRMHHAAANEDELLAIAVAYFAEGFPEPPPDLEATQSDLSELVRFLIGIEADATRRALLTLATDAIDDGLAGDAVAERLAAARSAPAEAIDAVELLVQRAREIAAGEGD